MTHTPNIVDYSVLPERLGRALLAEVRSLRSRTRRQSFVPTVHVRGIDGSGAPTGAGSADLLAAVRSPLDHALRVDLLVAATAGLRSAPHAAAAVFVVRPGPVEVTDDDLGWLRAWRVASDIAAVVAGPVWAIGRRGWLDVGANRATLPPRHRLRDRGSDRVGPNGLDGGTGGIGGTGGPRRPAGSGGG